MSDSVELLEYLYNYYKSESFQKRNRFGATPLHIACQYASSGFIMKIVNFLGYKVLLEADYSGRSSLHYLCSGLIDKYCITEVYNKLTAPCDIPLLMQITTFNVEGREDLVRRCIALNINVTKQHKRVRLLSVLFKKTSIVNNFNINAITTNGQSLVHLACTSGSILLVKVLEEYGINTSSLDYEGQSAVHYAALSGSPTLLHYTISQYNLNASQPDYKGVVPLALACMSGSINAVEYIINTTDSDINLTCNEGRTPLHYSCRHDNKMWDVLTHSAWSGNMKLVQYLINNHQLPLIPFALLQAVCSSLAKLLVNEYKLDPQVEDNEGLKAVHCAAEVGAIDVLKYLEKDCGCDLDVVGGVHNMNVFHYSTVNGHFSFIKYIINNYPQYTSLVHSINDNDAPPVHYACASGVLQLVIFLVDVMNCDLTTEDKNSYTCVTWACTSGNLDLLKLLIKQYKLNPRIFGEISSLEAAVAYGKVNILEWLRQEYHINIVAFKKGLLPFLAAQYNRTFQSFVTSTVKTATFLRILDNKGFNVMHISAKVGSLDILRFFIDGRYCNPDITDASGRTSLYFSAQEGHLEIVEYLLDSPSYNKPRVQLVDMPDSNGNTALHAACSQGHPDIVSTIAGAYKSLNIDIYSINEKRQTPLHLAAANGHVNTVVSLLSAIT
ncbi:PREDICTED: serine/threonine-protein phosphatase 6 regulatory ankyrin repeat subunit C-like, partial [Amphimedon queenslandica]|uniref:Uncharacterized protein n=1 Tax=Amphimedon queenslandica TaxID=400682 RepID=A0AAN0IS19_AMPQE